MVRFEGITKIYPTRRGPVAALEDVSFAAERGEFVAITGPSGCGKSTLLLMAGAMLRPTRGRVLIEGRDLFALSSGERSEFRGARLGFVFQLFHLVPYLSVLENVLLAARGDAADLSRRGDELLAGLGLSHRAHSKPGQLSAGEKQRTAIARAVIRRPALILADEPTGNLDRENEAEVFRILKEYARDGGTVLVVSHGEAADRAADRRIRLREGKVIAIEGAGPGAGPIVSGAAGGAA